MPRVKTTLINKMTAGTQMQYSTVCNAGKLIVQSNELKDQIVFICMCRCRDHVPATDSRREEAEQTWARRL